MGKKTTIIYKQSTVCCGYYIISQLNDVLQGGFYESPLDYNNADWFVNEVIKLENKMAFFFENNNKDIITTEEDEEDFQIIIACRFCGKNVESDKFRDHCHLTGKYRGPAHSRCDINVTQKQSFSIPFVFHNFINYDCHLLFKKLVD